jgi:rod shape-determining protein MreC
MLKRFTQARPFATLGVILAAWLVVPVVVKSFLRAGFFEFTAPITAAGSYVSVLQEYWALRLHSNRELIEAGRDLARINGFYEISVQENNALQAEIATLEKELGVPPRPGFRLEAARVVQRDFSGWWQRLVIRKGRNSGIAAGDPVVFSGGVVGRVAEVHAYTSVVELVSNPNFRIAAVIDGDTRPLSYQGGINATFGPARGLIEFVPLDVFAIAASPKRLVTSGLGGVFPAGLTIGRVTRTDPSTDGLFKTGEVELDSRLDQLTEVTVLVPRERGSPGDR